MSSNLFDSSQSSPQSLEWSAECFPNSSMNLSHQSTRSIHQRPAGVAVGTMASVAKPLTWTVNLECKVAADTRRIFDALTLPEYIEAWLCVPGHHPECSNVTSRVAHGFQIEHRCSSGSSTRIIGNYCSFLKRKLSFSWRPANGAETRDSFVDIRLHGDFERSVLRLRHFGLETEDDFNWHSALWSASIAKLCKLFERPTLSNEPRKQRAGRRGQEVYCEY